MSGYNQANSREEYGQYNPYDHDERYNQTSGYGNQQPYNDRPQPQTQSSSYYGNTPQRTHESAPPAAAGGYEMNNLNGQSGRSRDTILNECKDVDRGIDTIERNLETLRGLHRQAANATDTSANNPLTREMDRASNDTMDLYRNFVARMKKIKSDPESGNPRNAPQVGRVDRRLKDAINKYQQVEQQYRKAMQEQITREYRIVRPDASDAEVREAAEDTSNNQVFSQALLTSDRRGQAQNVANNVRNRHHAIQQIEKDMMTLAELFQDMEALVVQQEAAVQNIEQKGEEVTDNVGKANQEIDGAITKARSRNRKKWWCLLICLLIIIVIVVVVVVVVEVTKK